MNDLRSAHRSRGALVGVAAVAAAVPLAALAVPAAQAASLGKATVSQASGDETTYLVVDTAAKCPNAAKTLQMRLSGPGMDVSDGNNLLLGTTSLGIVPSSGSGYSVTATSTLQDLWQQYGTTAPAGTYTVTLRCSDASGFDDLGTFAGGIVATAGNAAYKATWARASSAQATATTLTSSPADPVVSGTTTTLTATVSPAAAGTVQLKRGAADLGTPITVSGGQAQWTGTLPDGTSSLTAVFTPADASAYSSSTSSALSYVVAGTPTITGTVRVGSTLTCAIPAGGTQTFAWTVGGVATAVTTQSVKAPAAWVGKAATCSVTTAKDSTSVVTTSAAKTVAKGVFRNTRRPAVTGTARVGKVLTCAKGSWSPTPSRYAYRWLRNGKVIAGTAATHKAVAADRGKKLSCQVTVSRAGYASAKATSAARTVS